MTDGSTQHARTSAAHFLVWWMTLVGWLVVPADHAVGQSRPSLDTDANLRILAASSLTEPLLEIERRWEESHASTVDISFGGSSRLASQLANGARADVYLSASRKWVEFLAEGGHLIDGTRRVFASNRLVWVVPSSNDAPYRSLDDVHRNPPERLALGGPNVPAGMYAREALETAGVWGRLAPNVVSAENVKRALQWVALGEAPAGVVYKTDALTSDDVTVAFELPQHLHPDIRYEGAVPSSARHPETGRAFLRYLDSKTGRTILSESGYSTALPGKPPTEPDTDPANGVDERSAIALSLLVGLGCVVGGLLPAVLLGWLLARRSFRGKSLVATLLLSPLALPPVVTGFMLLRLFGRSGVLGSALASVGVRVPFSTLGAGLAAFVVAFPLYLLTARSAFEIVDRRYEEVAMTLGNPPTTTFWRITIPLALPGIAAGALLAFARAIGEFGATAVLAGNVRGQTQTIPLAIYTLLESPTGYDSIWFLVGISLVLSLIAVLGFEWFNRRQRQFVDP